jgi:hypothetical protein
MLAPGAPLHESSWAGVFVLSTVKFVVAPGVGWGAGLNFLQALSANTSGAWASAAASWFLAGRLMAWAARRRRPDAPVFTRVNKWVTRMKRSRFGFALVVLLCPTFLSVPVGTVVVAKFYRHRPLALPAVFASLLGWSVVFNGALHVW